MSDWLLPTVTALRSGVHRLISRGQPAAGVAAQDDVIAGRAVRHHLPPAARDDALLLYFHGGGFISGSLDTHHALASALALHLGRPVLAASYRLAPEHPAPAQLDDALAVAEALAGTTPRLLIGGDSAGAWLALRVALELNGRAPGTVAATLLLYPFIDLAAQPDTLHLHARPAVALMRAALGQGYPSLLSLDLAAAPPAAMLWGAGLDPVAPGAAALAARLAQGGVAVRQRTHPLLVHGGLNLVNRVPGIDRLLAGAASDLKQLAGLA